MFSEREFVSLLGIKFIRYVLPVDENALLSLCR